ncbi:glucose 1-dehydrogenase [Candidatus Sumerlaeota bacterium]|nr:glucose 1-dehydrogenase [Candidatus Sumerlaeota bacterium]
MKNGVREKVVVVTGAGSGIGKATALAFARYGAYLVINDVNAKNLRRLHTLLEKRGNPAVAVQGDISLPEIQSRLVSRAVRRFRRIDVLVNNAGQLIVKPFLQHTRAELEKILSVNFSSVYTLTQRVVRVFARERISGSIVNVSSIAGEVGFSYLSAYSATKGALSALTRSLAVELSPLGIRVNAVLPGLVATRMTEQELRALERLGLGKRESLRKKFISEQLIPRMVSPDDVASAILFLADNSQSGTITGVCLPVDAGYLAR